MSRFYEPDLSVNPDSPFVRDASNKLVRRGLTVALATATPQQTISVSNIER
jgi:hypothetical protein